MCAIVLACDGAACSALLDFDLSGGSADVGGSDAVAADADAAADAAADLDGAPVGSRDAADERDPTRGPILRYDFESIDGGFVVDTSDSGNSGTLYLGDGGSQRVAGRTGGTAIQLANAGDRVDCARLAALPDEGTLVFWVRDEETDADTPGSTGLFSNRNTTSSRLLVWRQDGQPVRRYEIAFETASDSGATQFAASYKVDVDVDWTRISVVWSSITHKARLIVKRPANLVVQDLPLGGWQPGPQSCFFGQSWHGTVDDVAIYDRALSDAEIAALP